MKSKTTFFKKALMVVLTVLSVSANAQLTVNGTLTPLQWVQNTLVGTGITVSNVTYTGAAIAAGTFNGSASNIGFQSGVLLTSGSIQDAIGPNNQTSVTQNNMLPGDPDLDLIMAPYLSHDAAILEFDFVPVSDTVKFRYVFGSDEYMVYAGGGINDGFGFFISGPGITGPYSNNSTNIALIPGTSIPVTINNVNLNTNPQYYFDNGNGSGSGTAPDGLTIQYNGFTIPLTAISAVQCGQTYHIKIAIADGSDNILDSGVFLEAGSFSSTGVQIIPTISYGGPNDSVLFEGCGQACIYFVRTSNLSQSDTINVAISGTAINGVDYNTGAFGVPLPTQLIFAAGQDSISYCINAPTDSVPDGLQTIVLTINSTGPCQTTTTTAHIYLNEHPPLSLTTSGDTTLCNFGGTVQLNSIATGGVEPYIYSWTGGAGNAPDTAVNVSISTTYWVTVSDACNGNPDPTPPVTDSVRVNVILINDLTVNAGPDVTVCPDIPITFNAIVTGGANANPYLYQWSNYNAPDSLTNYNSAHTGSPGHSTGSYILTITDYCSNTRSDTVKVNVEGSCGLTFPNVISPDGNNINETFYVDGLDKYPGSSLVIYNRWGNKLFDTSNYDNKWTSSKCPDGTYFYVLNVSDGRSIPGYFQVVRSK